MRSGVLVLAVGALLLLAACTPQLGEREALPTAVPGVVVTGPDARTPVAFVGRWQAASGPTATPAAFATPLPPTPRPLAPKVMHEVDAKAVQSCLACHSTGRFAVPSNHVKRDESTCLGCHVVNYSAIAVEAPDVTHSVAGREDCLSCHLSAVGGASAMPAEHQGRDQSSCLICHYAASAGSTATPVPSGEGED